MAFRKTLCRWTMAGAACVASALALATPPQNAAPLSGSANSAGSVGSAGPSARLFAGLLVNLPSLTGIPGQTRPRPGSLTSPTHRPVSAKNARTLTSPPNLADSADNLARNPGNSADNPTGPLGRARMPRITRVALDDAMWLPPVRADLNAQVIRIPADASGSVMLETTVYRPDGPGPFPMIVFNHGKMPGDPRQQARSNPLPFAREFVRRGYVVVAPNRRGFAGSGGTYVHNDGHDGCDIGHNGIEQAADVAATVDYMAKQPYVDAAHIAIAGTSHGGLVTIAYGTRAAHGVRALINFSGGLRQDMCQGWQDNLTHAFGNYGANNDAPRVPSLWLYGDNDSVWSAALIRRMFAAYRNAQAQAAQTANARTANAQTANIRTANAQAGDTTARAQSARPAHATRQTGVQAGNTQADNTQTDDAQAAQTDSAQAGNARPTQAVQPQTRQTPALATLVDFGTYKNDAHRLVGDRDGVAIWWPPVEAFLARAGMPTAVRYAVAEPAAPRGTGYAAISAVGAVPYLDEAGRTGYRNFLKQYPTRAFAVSDSGAWSWAEGGDNPMTVAIANCEKRSNAPCRLYAVNNTVVWGNNAAATTAQANDDNNKPARAAVAGNASSEAIREGLHSLASR